MRINAWGSSIIVVRDISKLLDSRHGSYVELGALYTKIGRFNEAATALQKACEQDCYDSQAHIEIGHLFLQRNLLEPSEKHRTAAVHHFRQATHLDPGNRRASLGLAIAISQSTGDFAEAEKVLQEALKRLGSSQSRWHLNVALARLLIERGNATNKRQFYSDALAYAQEAISLASVQWEPYFVAAAAQINLVEPARNSPMKLILQHRALQYLQKAKDCNPGDFEVQRSLNAGEEALQDSRHSILGSVTVMTIGTVTLSVLWLAFFLSNKITALMLTSLTPVLVGLVIVGFLMPFVTRLKLPGIEADLSVSIDQTSPGLTGSMVFDPGKFSASASTEGPRGQSSRLESKR
jgi:tetratricopeptide (TPR) repeat protein